MPSKKNSSDLELLGLVIGIVSGVISIVREILGRRRGAKRLFQPIGRTLLSFFLGLQVTLMMFLMMIVLYTCGVTFIRIVRWSHHSKMGRFLVSGYPFGLVFAALHDQATPTKSDEWGGLRRQIPAASVL